jgi:uncharacterized protein (DUF924 family)
MDLTTKSVKKNYELTNVLYYWYFDPSNNSNLKNFENIKSYDLVDLWINKWFAKNEEQKKIDKQLLNFESLIEKYENYESCNLCEKMALIILFDQIPRNIYRGTAKAYQFDNIALKFAKSLLKDFDSLYFCFKLTVVICLIHSEDLSDHKIIKTLLPVIKSDKKCDPALYVALFGIHTNHNDRIEMFGRIPERNKFLGRISSENEKIYLSNI